MELLTRLFYSMLETEIKPEEWRKSVQLAVCKNKADVKSYSNYRGISSIQLWEQVVEASLRKMLTVYEQQYAFFLKNKGAL